MNINTDSLLYLIVFDSKELEINHNTSLTTTHDCWYANQIFYTDVALYNRNISNTPTTHLDLLKLELRSGLERSSRPSSLFSSPITIRAPPDCFRLEWRYSGVTGAPKKGGVELSSALNRHIAIKDKVLSVDNYEK